MFMVLKRLMKLMKTILLLVGMLFLAGCAIFHPNPVFKHISWQERQARIQQNKDWVIHGALSITSNNKRDIVRFEWQQYQDNYTINILGPMNLNKAKIVGSASKVELCQSNNKCVKAKTAEQLLFNQFGWRLPVSNIRYWVLATPAPTKIKDACFDQYGHLTSFKQQGWEISYSEFRVIKNMDLPSVVELKNKNFLIKLKVKDYFF
jgi:outer membrane lipoprotein LolB